jgi:hypothetical protein
MSLAPIDLFQFVIVPRDISPAAVAATQKRTGARSDKRKRSFTTSSTNAASSNIEPVGACPELLDGSWLTVPSPRPGWAACTAAWTLKRYFIGLATATAQPTESKKYSTSGAALPEPEQRPRIRGVISSATLVFARGPSLAWAWPPCQSGVYSNSRLCLRCAMHRRRAADPRRSGRRPVRLDPEGRLTGQSDPAARALGGPSLCIVTVAAAAAQERFFLILALI